MDTLAKEEKEKILRTLERDKEFRYTVMGLLGFREVLDRITGIAERQQALEERFAKLEERFARLEEKFVALEKRQEKLEERFVRIEERFIELRERQQQLEERFAKLEERFIALEERFARLEERTTRVEEALVGLQKTLATIAHRFGVMSEVAFREALAGVLEEFFGAKAHRWTYYDEKGFVYGRPSEVEVDVVVHDNIHILVELKSRADSGDVLELTRIAKLYEEREGVKPELAIVAGFVDSRARKLAEKLGVKIYTYSESQ